MSELKVGMGSIVIEALRSKAVLALIIVIGTIIICNRLSKLAVPLIDYAKAQNLNARVNAINIKRPNFNN